MSIHELRMYLLNLYEKLFFYLKIYKENLYFYHNIELYSTFILQQCHYNISKLTSEVKIFLRCNVILYLKRNLFLYFRNI